ncbi:MAG: glycosyltransferase family 4 protein [Myxococcaceae bacterium]|nr:glycosyltransferase family 4 protein [Myxococcaceae bacterium]
MRTILVTAYDVNPYKGSESGMGWNFIRQLARFYRVVAITRQNNRKHIERFLEEFKLSLPNLEFRYYDLPKALRFWKRGPRGSSLYFYLWQITMPAFIRASGLQFDLAHNLNFHADWAPSMLWTFGKPFIWGPIGHHPKIPPEFMRDYGFDEKLKDQLKWMAKQGFWSFDALLWMTRRKADLVFCMNSSVADALRLEPGKVAILPSVGSEDPGPPPQRHSEKFRVISVGRFVPLKGFDVTLRSFTAFFRRLTEEERARVELVLVGAGPERDFLKRLSESLDVRGNVRFIDWMDRRRLHELYRASSCFLFPSHEGAGMVVAEALSHGLPVVCFDNVGPGELIDEGSGVRVPYGSYEQAVHGFADALWSLYADEDRRNALSKGARRRFETWLDWNAKGEFMHKAIEAAFP